MSKRIIIVYLIIDLPHGGGRLDMTKYTAIFEDGFEISKTSEEFKHRLAFYNWICLNRIGKEHGDLLEIVCSITPR